jgi:hypothetical protein
MRRALLRHTPVIAGLACLLLAAPSFASSVQQVRVGNHPTFTRVVFELDAPSGYRIEKGVDQGTQELIVTLEASSTPRSVRSGSPEVGLVSVQEGKGQTVAHIRLRSANSGVKEMILSDPPRIVIDLMREPSRIAAENAAVQKRAAAKAPSVEEAKAKLADVKPVEPKPAEPVVAPKASTETKPPAVAVKPLVEPKAPVVAKPAAESKPPVVAVTPAIEPKAPVMAKPAAEPKPPVVAAKPALEPKPPVVAAKPNVEPKPPSVAVKPPVEPVVAPKPPVKPSEAPELAKLETRPTPTATTPAPEAKPAPQPEVSKPASAPTPAPLAPAAKPVETAVAPKPETKPESKPAPAPVVPAPAPQAVPAPPELAKAAPPEAPVPAPAAKPSLPAPESLEKPPAPVAPAPAEVAKTHPTTPAAHAPAPTADDSKLFGLELAQLAALGGGVLLLVVLVVMLMRRRRLPNDLDVTALVDEDAEPPLSEGLDFGAGEREGAPVATPPRSAPERLTQAQAPTPPIAAPGGVFGDTDQDLFDTSEKGENKMSQDTLDLPVSRSQRPNPAPTLVTSAAGDSDVARLVRELERRIAQVETRLDEANDARERLERQVAAQSEELRVQRAAIARTQRALRGLNRGDEEQATEPALRDPSRPMGGN